jgi:hypothetical protein
MATHLAAMTHGAALAAEEPDAMVAVANPALAVDAARLANTTARFRTPSAGRS